MDESNFFTHWNNECLFEIEDQTTDSKQVFIKYFKGFRIWFAITLMVSVLMIDLRVAFSILGFYYLCSTVGDNTMEDQRVAYS